MLLCVVDAKDILAIPHGEDEVYGLASYLHHIPPKHTNRVYDKISCCKFHQL